MKSEFDTLEQYQESMKEFNENTRMEFEEFIQSHGSDRNKLQLRCTPYTSKKGGYGSFDLDFGLCVYQHQQSKVDDLEHKAKLRESDHKALLVKYQATKKCWEDISKEKEELQRRNQMLNDNIKEQGQKLVYQNEVIETQSEKLLGLRNEKAELQKNINLLKEALDIKEQLNQKLREREDELQKRVNSTLKVVQSMRNEVKHGHMSDEEVQMLSSFADDLEQALNGGGE